MTRNNDKVVVWRLTNVAEFSWTQVQLTLPVGVAVIRVDAVSAVESQAVNYIAIDDVTITSGDCPQPGNVTAILIMLLLLYSFTNDAFLRLPDALNVQI